MDKIIGDWHKLMLDGADTANYYLAKAIESIDNQLGEGYAKAHPKLISGWMNTAAKDCSSTTIAKAIQDTKISNQDI